MISFPSLLGGSLAARASFLVSSPPVATSDLATYVANTVSAVQALQTWYDTSEGLWNTTGWWNSANCLQVLADFSALDADDANDLNLGGVMANTFTAAQQTVQTAAKTMLNGLGMVLIESTYTKTPARDLNGRGNSGFLNNFYDDEGWWALALIRSYDVTGVPGYLDVAQNIFEDMKAGGDDVCGGGIWWSKDKTYKNAIANELYLAVAASLANRVPARKQEYLSIATQQWTWFNASGMINSAGLINDGLKIKSDGSCVNNNQAVWSYNQGVVLGGLVELSKAMNGSTATKRANSTVAASSALSSSSLLDAASQIAAAAISSLSVSGILTESCEPDCFSGDVVQFKGIFMRNLHYLQLAAPQDAFRNFILANADSIWTNDRDASNKLGMQWVGPASAGDGPTAGTHSSAMDALVAAVAVV